MMHSASSISRTNYFGGKHGQLSKMSEEIQQTENQSLKELLYERYKDYLDLSDADRNRYASFSKELTNGLKSDDPGCVKRIISNHIHSDPEKLIRMKLLPFPLPPNEELMVRRVMDSCPFKAALSCFGV
ncbi:unnamed protein product [Heterobilharzia americana]|nr:unnamed protein product [Heterobilharzia americana]